MLQEHADSLEEIKATLTPEHGIGPGVFSYVCYKNNCDAWYLYSVGKGARYADSGILNKKWFTENKQKKIRVTVQRADFVKSLEEKLQLEIELASEEIKDPQCNRDRWMITRASNIDSTEELYRSVIKLLNDADGVVEEAPIAKSLCSARVSKVEAQMHLKKYREGRDKITNEIKTLIEKYHRVQDVILITLTETKCMFSAYFVGEVRMSTIEDVLEEIGGCTDATLHCFNGYVSVTWSMS